MEHLGIVFAKMIQLAKVVVLIVHMPYKASNMKLLFFLWVLGLDIVFFFLR